MEQFNTWLQTSQPNEKIEYYEGYIGKERFIGRNKKKINNVADYF